jgi:hypothetical protein
LPSLKLGAFEVPRVPGIAGESVIKQREDGLGIELDGLVGSGLLATFRVTLVDGGRTMWLEDLPQEALNQPSLFATPPSAIDQNFDDPDVDTDAEEAPEAPAKGGKAAPKAKAPAAPKAAPAAPAAPKVAPAPAPAAAPAPAPAPAAPKPPAPAPAPAAPKAPAPAGAKP